MTVSVGTSGFPAPQLDNALDGTQMPSIYIDKQGGAWAIGAPSVDFTPAADPHVQALVTENAQLKAERDQLASINARLTRKLANLRDGIGVLAERIKERG